MRWAGRLRAGRLRAGRPACRACCLSYNQKKTLSKKSPCRSRGAIVLLICRVQDAIVAVSSGVYHADAVGLDIEEDEEIMLKQLHLQDRFFCRHRGETELFALDDLLLLLFRALPFPGSFQI